MNIEMADGPVLACMGGGDILIVLALILGGGILLQVLAYLPYRWAMNALARGSLFGKPLALFVASVGGLFFCSFGMLIAVGVLMSGNALQILTGVLSIGGAFSFFALGVGWLKSREPMTSAKLPFQVWFQDMIVAMICYGAGLTIIAAAGNFNSGRAEEFLPWAVYLLLAGTCGLFAAVDVSRRSELAQRPGTRAGLFVAIFTVFPLTLPLALLAWWRWRRSLKKYAAA